MNLYNQNPRSWCKSKTLIRCKVKLLFSDQPLVAIDFLILKEFNWIPKSKMELLLYLSSDTMLIFSDSHKECTIYRVLLITKHRI